jgi:DNA-binding MarR family transcriptional regulator
MNVQHDTSTQPARHITSRSQVASIFRLLQKFREIYSDVPVQVCTTFICIAERPGITQAEIAKSASMTIQSVSRHMRILGRYNSKRREGYDLIAAEVDEDDTRRKRLYLTAKGYALLSGLLDITS